MLNGIYKDKILFSMKKLIFKNFYTDTLSFFFTSLLTMSLIVWTLQAVNYFDFVTEDGHGLEIYFYYTFLSFPKILGALWGWPSLKMAESGPVTATIFFALLFSGPGARGDPGRPWFGQGPSGSVPDNFCVCFIF